MGQRYGNSLLKSSDSLTVSQVALKRPIGGSEEVLCLVSYILVIENLFSQLILQRFIREVYIWWKAGDHPNVHKLPGIYFLEREGVPTMVSLWCDKGNLACFLEDPPPTWNRTEQLKIVSNSFY